MRRTPFMSAAALSLLAVLGLGLGAGPQLGTTDTAPVLKSQDGARSGGAGLFGGNSGTASYPSREGWTNARYRRAAAKRRRVAANRRAHRG